MAEAFARAYGSDVMVPSSAGVSPGANPSKDVCAVLEEKNIQAGDHAPRNFHDLNPQRYDLIVNLSGTSLPLYVGTPVETWTVKDPYGGTLEEYRRARDEIEMAVMRLILRIRMGKFDSGEAVSSK
jgi:arsenate reductase (thioredoxin)